MTVDPSLALILAETVLLLHAGIAAFVVGGLVVIVVGNLRRWHWVNEVRLRLAHLAAIAIVASETWLGVVCPLTTLEMWLRARAGVVAYGGGFIGHWLDRILYVTAPPWMFTVAYSIFALLVVATWWIFPPWRRRSRVRRRSDATRECTMAADAASVRSDRRPAL